MAEVGAFNTEDLLAWFSSVSPSSSVPRRQDLFVVPPTGTVGHNLRRKAEKEERERRGRQEREPPMRVETTTYVPDYNTVPDDEKAFDYVDEYDVGPGNPTNPNALPGDYDYAVSQSTDVYDQFNFNVDNNPRLPIHQHKNQILGTIESGQVCGKMAKNWQVKFYT